jgi:hypothetical protein
VEEGDFLYIAYGLLKEGLSEEVAFDRDLKKAGEGRFCYTDMSGLSVAGRINTYKYSGKESSVSCWKTGKMTSTNPVDGGRRERRGAEQQWLGLEIVLPPCIL